MKTKTLTLFLSAIFGPVLCFASNDSDQKELSLSPSEDEVFSLDQLIAMTDQRLSEQKHLKALMVKFKEQKKQFIDGKATKKDAYYLVKTASEVLKIIHDCHLQYLFSPTYLEELKFFSSIAGKNSPVRP